MYEVRIMCCKNYASIIVFSYFYEDERGLFPECQFVMDLEVPEDFTPVNADGETESFQLVSVAEVCSLCSFLAVLHGFYSH